MRFKDIQDSKIVKHRNGVGQSNESDANESIQNLKSKIENLYACSGL